SGRCSPRSCRRAWLPSGGCGPARRRSARGARRRKEPRVFSWSPRLIDSSAPGQTGTYCCMDNLTHSLIGIVAGDTVARSARSATGGLSADTRRAFLVTVSVIGGNLPDSDLLVSYSGFTRDKLAYMLQHRGYTHTIVGCVILA